MMEITLEKIELVKDRTGVSYKEAKEALEFTDGNVVDAIIYIEENIDNSFSKNDKKITGKIVDTVKEAVRKGNVTKLRIYHGDNIVLNLPVNFGVVGTVLFPWGAVASAVAAAVTKCRVELVKEDGGVINVSEKAGDVIETVKEKGGVVVDEVMDKGSEFYAVAKEKGSDLYATAKEKGSGIYESAREMGTGIYSVAKEKGGELYDAAKDKGSELYSAAREKGSELYDAAKDKGTELYNAAVDKKDDISDRLGRKAADLGSGGTHTSFGEIANNEENKTEE